MPFNLNTDTLELKITASHNQSQENGFCVEFVPDGIGHYLSRYCVFFGPVSTIVERNCIYGDNLMSYKISEQTTFWNFSRQEDKVIAELRGVGRIGNGVSLRHPCNKKTVWLYFWWQGQITLHYKPKGGIDCGFYATWPNVPENTCF